MAIAVDNRRNISSCITMVFVNHPKKIASFLFHETDNMNQN